MPCRPPHSEMHSVTGVLHRLIGQLKSFCQTVTRSIGKDSIHVRVEELGGRKTEELLFAQDTPLRFYCTQIHPGYVAQLFPNRLEYCTMRRPSTLHCFHLADVSRGSIGEDRSSRTQPPTQQADKDDFWVLVPLIGPIKHACCL